jgi:hypothetical protein
MNNPQAENMLEQNAIEWEMWRSGASPHLPYCVQRDYVLHRISVGDAELIEEHIEECALCATELADLKAFARQESPVLAPEVSHAPEMVPVAVVGESPQDKTYSFLRSLRALFSSPTVRPAWGIASILAGVLLGGSILWAGVVVPQQRTLAQMQTELASLKSAVRATPTSETITTITTLRKELSRANQKYEDLTAQMKRQADRLTQLSDAYASLKKQEALRVAEDPRVANAPHRTEVNPRPGKSLPVTLNLPDLTPLAMVASTGIRGSAGNRPAPSAFSLISPVATKTPLVRPTLRWNALSGAVSYRATIRSVDGRFIEVSAARKQNAWSPPELKPGGIFEWQVVALNASGEKIAESAIGRFAVLSRTEERAYHRNQKRYSGSPLGVIVAGAEAGLWEMAEQSLITLLSQEPDGEQRNRAEEWLKQIRAKRARLFSGGMHSVQE